MFRKDHIPELDGLRGIAVLLVLWVHLPGSGLGPLGREVRAAIMPGNVGVDLFFVLSGFLITRILLVDRGTERPLRFFLMRRFLRIFPIYYLLLLGLSPLLQREEVLACATYTSNYAFLFKSRTSLLENMWSLAIEEHFYLLWPPVAVFLSTRASRRVLIYGVLPASLLTGVLVVLLGDWSQDGPLLSELIAHGSTSRFGSLGLGALLAYHEGFVRARRAMPLAVAGGLLSLSLALSAAGRGALGLDSILASVSPLPGDPQPLLPVLRLISFPALSLGVLIVSVHHTGRALPWVQLLRVRPLKAVGRISYGLYLFHFPIFMWLLAPGSGEASPGPARVLLALAASFAAAGLSYAWIERPILRLGARFRAPAVH